MSQVNAQIANYSVQEKEALKTYRETTPAKTAIVMAQRIAKTAPPNAAARARRARAKGLVPAACDAAAEALPEGRCAA